MKDNIIKQPWGYEIRWTNTSDYASKIVVFEKAGSKSDMIFHKEGKKSWFINEGAFKVRWIDTSNGMLNEKELRQGDVWDIIEMQPHSLESVYPNSSLTEVNNSIQENDQYTIISNKTFMQGETNV